MPLVLRTSIWLFSRIRVRINWYYWCPTCRSCPNRNWSTEQTQVFGLLWQPINGFASIRTWSNYPTSQLTWFLFIPNNELTGSLPSELGLLTQLTRFGLYSNQATGSLPTELGLLTKLRLVYLYDNALTGSVPSSLCSSGAIIYIDCGEIACTCCLAQGGFPCIA